MGTVADLLALQGQDPEIDAVLDRLTVDDVFPGLVAVSDQAWEDIDLAATPLQNVASPLESTVTYTDGFVIGGSLPTKVTVDFTMADGFQYTPGTTKLDGAASPDPVLASPGVLRFSLTGVAPGPHFLSFGNRAGTDLGPKAASVKVTATVGTDTGTATATTPVTVVESFERTAPPNDFKVLAADTLFVSHISSATDTDLYRFDITAQQAQSGTTASLFLGNLGADYDLTLYGPPPASSARAADESQASVEDVGLDASPSRDSVAPDLVDDVPVRTGLGAVAAVGASRGTQDEQIETGTLVAGTYWLQVSGYNGAFSPKPYVLRERISARGSSRRRARRGRCRSPRRPGPRSPTPTRTRPT